MDVISVSGWIVIALLFALAHLADQQATAERKRALEAALQTEAVPVIVHAEEQEAVSTVT